MNLRILKALLRKEFTMMRHNSLIMKVIFVMPLMVMLVMPLVANLDVTNVNVTVVDNDRSQLSRRIIADIRASERLTLLSVLPTHAAAIDAVERGSVDAILTIPPHYERNMASSLPAADVEANGVNATKGMLGAQYLSQTVAMTIAQWRAESGQPAVASSSPSIINRYNPTLNFRNYMIPALMVMLLIIICGFLPALNLVSEKETGTIEAMNVTPVGKLTFMLSKLIPFWIVGLIVVTVGMLIGRIVYGLAPCGSIPAIYLATILFSLVMSGLGTIVANRSATMLQSIFIMFAFTMVFQLMSGLFTPILSMPAWARAITYAIPPRYYIEIMRSLYLKATPLSELLPQYGALLLLATTLLLLSALSYRKQS